MEQVVTTANGTSLCIESFGDPAGPLCVQLEGHMAQMIAIPTGFCDRVADAGIHLVRVDNRDVGRSQRFPAGYTLLDMADDVHGLVERLGGGPAVVCGRSMGGMVAQYLACAHPQDVAALGLFFTRPPLPRTAALVGEQPDAAADPSFTDEGAFVAWELESLPGLAGPRYPFPPGYLEQLARAAWRRGVDTEGFARQARAMATTPDWSDRVRGLRIPVTIIHGDADPVIPLRFAHDLVALLPQADLHVVPGMGHQQPPELDDLFAGVVLDLHRAAGRRPAERSR